MAGPPSDGPRYVARLTSRTAGRPLVPVTLALGADVLRSHVMPGQYVSIVVAGENGYFVIASPVGARDWCILVKGGGTVADALLAESLGAEFSVSAALGRGFPCEEARGRPLVVVAAGTGIAAAIPIAARRIADGDAARTHLFLGLRNAVDLPCPEELDVWRGAGVVVLLCLSREDGDGVNSVPGYVQDVARERVAKAEGTMIFAVGPSAMVDAARALAPRLGASEADLRTNY